MNGPVHAIHIRRDNNIGDAMSSPALYFRFRRCDRRIAPAMASII